MSIQRLRIDIIQERYVMKNVYVFLATGFEEIEALTPVDILRRAGMDVRLVSVSGSETVKGARNIEVKSDLLFDDIDKDFADILVLPGGMPGTTNLMNCKPLTDLVIEYFNKGKHIAAICAAPTIFGKLNLLKGKNATCYPGMEDELIGANVRYESVVTDSNVTTSRGMGTAIDFSLELLKLMSEDKNAANNMADKVVYKIK